MTWSTRHTGRPWNSECSPIGYSVRTDEGVTKTNKSTTFVNFSNIKPNPLVFFSQKRFFEVKIWKKIWFSLKIFSFKKILNFPWSFFFNKNYWFSLKFFLLKNFDFSLKNFFFQKELWISLKIFFNKNFDLIQLGTYWCTVWKSKEKFMANPSQSLFSLFSLKTLIFELWIPKDNIFVGTQICLWCSFFQCTKSSSPPCAVCWNSMATRWCSTIKTGCRAPSSRPSPPTSTSAHAANSPPSSSRSWMPTCCWVCCWSCTIPIDPAVSGWFRPRSGWPYWRPAPTWTSGSTFWANCSTTVAAWAGRMPWRSCSTWHGYLRWVSIGREVNRCWSIDRTRHFV